jgi:glycosyltransferase involved in cell wall biosynthesis
VIRYGAHNQSTYRKLLARSRFIVFLGEHETQGFAYQEAMASNLPVLAWNPGFWVDPNRLKYTSDPVPSCSVPYFSDECGATFREPDEFKSALQAFVGRLDSFRPRQFVQQHLSFESSAQTYLRHYDALAASRVRPGHDRICRGRLSET